ncbi:MAG: hypothetical protein Ct9H300mP11_02970 [Chloroflexota bacterium]|nr:MAG: hypothetical protein Ct9H300mP11_02970 [Chloroflexota bacterium]
MSNDYGYKVQTWHFSESVNVDAGSIAARYSLTKTYTGKSRNRVCPGWLFVGHESQITKPGDYFVSSMGRNQ